MLASDFALQMLKVQAMGLYACMVDFVLMSE